MPCVSFQEMALQADAIRKQIIEEERQKLLQEHASKLIGHLPRVSVQLLQTYCLMFGMFSICLPCIDLATDCHQPKRCSMLA